MALVIGAAGLLGATSAAAGGQQDSSQVQAQQDPRRLAALRAQALDDQQRHATQRWLSSSERRAVRDAVLAEEARRAEEARLAEAARLAEEARRAAAEEATRSARRDPRGAARPLVAERGWGGEQFGCLDKLWTKESNWRVDADNPTSSAYGIPQALPGRKMASAGADWETNPLTQIRWGLRYIADRYGSPCAAWAHSRANNWY